MSKKRFTFYYERGNEVVIEENGKRISNKKVVDLLNKLYEENEQLKYDNFMFKGVIETFQKVAISERKKLEKENEQLQKQIQNYEQLISNSYVGEEETLDGFVGKYVI